MFKARSSTSSRPPGSKRKQTTLVAVGAEPSGAVVLQHHPDLERPETSRRLERVVLQELARGNAARRPLQVLRALRECPPVHRAVADEDAAHVEGRMEPLVQVEREGIRPFDPGD